MDGHRKRSEIAHEWLPLVHLALGARGWICWSARGNTKSRRIAQRDKWFESSHLATKEATQLVCYLSLVDDVHNGKLLLFSFEVQLLTSQKGWPYFSFFSTPASPVVISWLYINYPRIIARPHTRAIIGFVVYTPFKTLAVRNAVPCFT